MTEQGVDGWQAGCGHAGAQRVGQPKCSTNLQRWGCPGCLYPKPFGTQFVCAKSCFSKRKAERDRYLSGAGTWWPLGPLHRKHKGICPKPGRGQNPPRKGTRNMRVERRKSTRNMRVARFSCPQKPCFGTVFRVLKNRVFRDLFLYTFLVSGDKIQIEIP